jgi:hypothetical protein
MIRVPTTLVLLQVGHEKEVRGPVHVAMKRSKSLVGQISITGRSSRCGSYRSLEEMQNNVFFDFGKLNTMLMSNPGRMRWKGCLGYALFSSQGVEYLPTGRMQ